MLGIIISIVLCQARHTSANVNKKFGRVGKALLPTCTSAQISKCSNRTSILGSSIPTLKFETAPFFQKQRKSTFDRNTRELMSNFPIESNKTQEDSGALLIDKIKP
jgi:hypothetical protein